MEFLYILAATVGVYLCIKFMIFCDRKQSESIQAIEDEVNLEYAIKLNELNAKFEEKKRRILAGEE